MSIFNITKNTIIAQKVKTADTFFPRVIGLLGRSAIDYQEALIIVPCQAIHMFFMKFPIDVIFLNRAGGIIALYPNLKPLRMTWIHLQATRAVECAWGTIERWHLKKGEVLRIES